MADNVDYLSLMRTMKHGTAANRARLDSTALLIAKYLELGTKSKEALEETMAALLGDPERAGGVILTLVNLVIQYATQSMTSPEGLKALIDELIRQLEIGAFNGG